MAAYSFAPLAPPEDLSSRPENQVGSKCFGQCTGVRVSPERTVREAPTKIVPTATPDIRKDGVRKNRAPVLTT
jgi:hypothetical protein